MPSPEHSELAERFLRKAREDIVTVEILTASDRAASAVIGYPVPEEVRDARWLTPWAVEFRYDEDPGAPLDRSAALQTIQTVERWATRAIEGPDADTTDPDAGVA